jgi:hypothetical protein
MKIVKYIWRKFFWRVCVSCDRGYVPSHILGACLHCMYICGGQGDNNDLSDCDSDETEQLQADNQKLRKALEDIELFSHDTSAIVTAKEALGRSE